MNDVKDGDRTVEHEPAAPGGRPRAASPAHALAELHGGGGDGHREGVKRHSRRNLDDWPGRTYGNDSTNTATNARIHWVFGRDASGTPTITPTRDRRPRPGGRCHPGGKRSVVPVSGRCGSRASIVEQRADPVRAPSLHRDIGRCWPSTTPAYRLARRAVGVPRNPCRPTSSACGASAFFAARRAAWLRPPQLVRALLGCAGSRVDRPVVGPPYRRCGSRASIVEQRADPVRAPSLHRDIDRCWPSTTPASGWPAPVSIPGPPNGYPGGPGACGPGGSRQSTTPAFATPSPEPTRQPAPLSPRTDQTSTNLRP